MKIVFFGTPEFAVASLDAIQKHGYDVAAVVTMPDRKGGRGNKLIESDVKKYAMANNLPVLQPEKLRDESFLKELRKIEADLFIVIAFRMLPEVVWKMPRLGTFNLHASLLPDFRGAAPINHAIMAGRRKTGVTTFFINEEIDKGNILMRMETEISEKEDAGALHDRLMEMGARLVVDTIEGIEKQTITPLPQIHSGEILPAPKIFKDNCRIDFGRKAIEVDCFIRGLSPYPGAWSIIELDNGKPLEIKILKATPSTDILALNPGDIKQEGNRFYTGTAEGNIEILELQPAGKRRMLSKEFLAGYRPVRFSQEIIKQSK